MGTTTLRDMRLTQGIIERTKQLRGGLMTDQCPTVRAVPRALIAVDMKVVKVQLTTLPTLRRSQRNNIELTSRCYLHTKHPDLGRGRVQCCRYQVKVFLSLLGDLATTAAEHQSIKRVMTHRCSESTRNSALQGMQILIQKTDALN